MLKRSLGGRTWNAGEIAGDLRRLNEDVKMFLSIHTVRQLRRNQTRSIAQPDFPTDPNAGPHSNVRLQLAVSVPSPIVVLVGSRSSKRILSPRLKKS
jgi:hypothetical protein